MKHCAPFASTVRTLSPREWRDTIPWLRGSTRAVGQTVRQKLSVPIRLSILPFPVSREGVVARKQNLDELYDLLCDEVYAAKIKQLQDNFLKTTAMLHKNSVFYLFYVSRN